MPPAKYRKLFHKCQQCGQTYDLLVHHIDKDRSNNSASNLVVVCMSCHAIIHKRITNIRKMKCYYETDINQLTFSFFK